jgi:hypothetical protein
MRLRKGQRRITTAVAATVGLIAMTSAMAFAAASSAVYASATPRTVLVGTPIAVTGRATVPRAGDVVALQRYFGAAWHNLSTAPMTATGAFRFTAKPVAVTTWTLRVHRYATSAATGADTAAIAVRVVSAPYVVTLTNTPASTPMKTTFTLVGAVRPAAPGTRVYLQRQTASTWSTVATATVASTSVFTFTRSEPAPSRPRYRVVKPYSSTVATGTSKVVTELVTGRIVVPFPTTVTVGATAVASITQYEASSDTVLKSGVKPPGLGGHLAVPSISGHPSGLLGNVTALVANSDGTTTVTTTPARLDDVYSKYEVVIDEPLATATAPVRDSALRAAATSGSNAGYALDAGLFTCDAFKPLKLGLKADLSAIHVQAQVSLAPPTVYFLLTAYPTFTASVSLQGRVSCHANTDAIALHFYFPTTPPLELVLKPVVTVSASASVTFAATWAPRMVLGLQRGNGVSTTTHSFGSSASFQFSGAAGFRVFGGLSAELRLPGGRVGLSGEFGPVLVGNVSGSCVSVNSRLHADLKLNVDLILKEKSFVLAQGDFGDQPVYQHCGTDVTPPASGGGSPPPDGGTTPTSETPPGTGIVEQQGHYGVNTFVDYHTASGVGDTVSPGSYVRVSCKVYDPNIASVNPDGYWYRIASAPWNDAYFAPANTFMNGDPWGGPYTHNTDFAVPDCFASPEPGTSAGPTVNEQEGHYGVNTFTDYHNASGVGPSIGPGVWVAVSCKVHDGTIASVNPDGYWYRIASSPWNDAYYAPANTFMNGDPWGGPYSHNTDFAVPDCGGSGGGGGTPPPTWAETTGGVTHTWTNYTNAGGTQGQSIAAYQTVQIACKLTGFKVADGNTWWYRIASSPWSGAFYASADAFYNNGQTSGSLAGTPFVDSNVADC